MEKNYKNWRQEILLVAGFMQGLHHKILIGALTYSQDFEDDDGNVPNIGDTTFHLATGEQKVVREKVWLSCPKVTYKGRSRSTSTGETPRLIPGTLDKDSVKVQAQWDSDNASLVGIIRMYMEPAYRYLVSEETIATVI